MPDEQNEALDRIERHRRRVARFTDSVITTAHGAGGRASAALVEAIFRPAFDPDAAGPLTDGSRHDVPDGHEIVFTTDSYVVQPLRFPGGSIGHLAVHGTVNDLAVCGATPRWLSAAFVIEEGFAVDELRAIVDDMASAATAAGVRIVTGDTKVVERGAADGLYITTAGVGVAPVTRRPDVASVEVGDAVILSGPIADHGMAVLLARGDLAIDAAIETDTASIAGLVEAAFAATDRVRWMRDPTRGGLASAANELAADSGLCVLLDESAIPVRPAVGAACEWLGIDPLYVANEGKAVFVVAADDADRVVDALRTRPGGDGATVIGEIVADPPGLVVLRTPFGGTRIVDMLVGDPLPRIC